MVTSNVCKGGYCSNMQMQWWSKLQTLYMLFTAELPDFIGDYFSTDQDSDFSDMQGIMQSLYKYHYLYISSRN